MQDFTPNLAAGINRACCERFLSPTAAKLQYGDVHLAITEMLRGSNYFCEVQTRLSVLPHCAFP
jgi:hypothetical protein